MIKTQDPVHKSKNQCHSPPARNERLFRGRKFESRGINAVAFAGLGGAVIENMPEVPPALFTENLGPFHTVTEIFFQNDLLSVCGRLKAGPAGTGIKFSRGIKKHRAASRATVKPLGLVVDKRAAKSRLSLLLPQDAILLRRELCFPLSIGFLRVAHRRFFAAERSWPKEEAQDQSGRQTRLAVERVHVLVFFAGGAVFLPADIHLLIQFFKFGQLFRFQYFSDFCAGFLAHRFEFGTHFLT